VTVDEELALIHANQAPAALGLGVPRGAGQPASAAAAAAAASQPAAPAPAAVQPASAAAASQPAALAPAAVQPAPQPAAAGAGAAAGASATVAKPLTRPIPSGLPPPETGLPPLPATDASTWDVMAAGWQAETIRTDAWSYSQKQRQALTDDLFARLPKDARQRVMDRRWDHDNNGIAFEDMVLAEVAKAAAADPQAWGDQPLSRAAFDAQLLAQRKSDMAEAQGVLDQPGGAVAEFVGSSARAMTDATSLMLMPLGVGGGAVRTILTETVLGGIGGAATLPREFQVADELGLPTPDVVSRIALSAALGGGLSAGILGIIKGFGLVSARRAAIRAATPGGGDDLASEIAIDKAEARMQDQQTVPERIARAEANAKPEAGTLSAVLADGNGAGALPPIAPDAPENWRAIRGGIFQGESGGDYNALFGFSNRAGGPFQDVKLTELTVDDALAFADPSGAYGQWVKGKIGRVATPMGAYQIVGATLRAAKRGLGLRGSELMTPDLQERLGVWIYRTQGTGAWTGYVGPRPNFVPGANAARWTDPSSGGPAYSGTSRGYTGRDQVAVGDSMRIDVAYEVVDASSLVRAFGDLQPRDRSRIASDAQIADIAARLDPAKLMPAPDAANGAPIVGPDNIIESGNGRVAAIGRAFDLNPDRAAAYRAEIEANGFAIPEGVTRPVLIARRKTELSHDERVRLVNDAQDSGVAVLTPTEMARTAARAMTAPVLGRLDPALPLGVEANAAFIRAALAGLPRSARNAMFDAGGLLNKSGERQLREALFARAWSDPDIIEMFAETDAGELRSLMDALGRSAPNWAALKADIEAGLVRPEMDISGHVLDAMRMIATARTLAGREGMSIGKALAELLDDVDLYAGAVSPLTTALIRKFWRNGRAASADDVTAFLTRYADDARKAGAAGGLFDGPGPRDVLRAIDPETFGDLPENLGAVRGFAQKPAPPVAAPARGYDAGAASPEAEAADAALRDALEQPASEKQRADLAAGQAVDPERAAALAEIAAARADLGDEMLAIKFTGEDGTPTSLREILDDVSDDANATAALRGCGIIPKGTP